MRVCIGLLLGAAVFCALPDRLPASSYYFSAMGNDQNGTGTELNPWKSITKFNSLDLNPGDSVYFRAGDTFHGSLLLDANDTGLDAAGDFLGPVTISSYGGAAGQRAEIRSRPQEAALSAINNGGIELRNLEFSNGGSYASNPASGIQFLLNTSAASSHFDHIRVDNVVAHGFHESGLSIATESNIGYRDIAVANSEFYGNQFAGVNVSAAAWTELVHHDLQIENVSAHDNPGYSGCSPHCGHGIVIGQIDGAVIENSRADANGIDAGKGNVGIWAWQSNKVAIQHNVAIGNRSPNGGDGGGFDLDGGVTNSVVQYNVAQDNAGAGYLLAEFAFAGPMSQNVIRYNLSVNDGRDGYGAITIAGDSVSYPATTAVVHNNTVVVDKNVTSGSRGPVWFLNSAYSDVRLVNNVFVALNGTTLVDGPVNTGQTQFINNAYWTSGQPIVIGGQTYPSIAAWAVAAQQEMLNGAFVGLQTDPMFALTEEYGLAASSPLVNAGANAGSGAWPSWLIDLGPTDLYGTPIPQGAQVDIGAVEYVPFAGDYNRNGAVDAADYVVWRKLQGSTGAGLPADADQNGIVDAADYDVWTAHFGRTAVNGVWFPTRASIVSEPQNCGAAVVCVAGVLLLMGPARVRFCENFRL